MEPRGRNGFQKRGTMTMYCDFADVPVYYEVRGEGRPILIIHGFSVDHRLMEG